MKRLSFILFAFLLVSGCKIEFEAETAVRPDGSVTRATRYAADQEEDKKELESQYDLPSGGTWTEKAGVAFAVYELKKRFAPGEPIPPDCVRRGKILKDIVSSNEIKLTAQNTRPYRIFYYEERFPALADKEALEPELRAFYESWLDEASNSVAEKLEGRVQAGRVKEALRQICDPPLTVFIEMVKKGGIEFVDNDLYNDESLKALDPEKMPAYLAKALPPPSPEEETSWTEAIKSAIEKANEAIGKRAEDSGLLEKLLGVYGFSLFQSYDFKISLKLPGKILDNNATRRDGNTLIWEFDSSDFQWEDYIIRARSKSYGASAAVLYAAILTAVFALLGFFVYNLKKRKA